MPCEIAGLIYPDFQGAAYNPGMTTRKRTFWPWSIGLHMAIPLGRHLGAPWRRSRVLIYVLLWTVWLWSSALVHADEAGKTVSTAVVLGPLPYRVMCLAVSPDGTQLAAGTGGLEASEIHLWNVSTRKKESAVLKGPSYIYSLSFSPDGRTLASGGNESIVRIWNLPEGNVAREISGFDRRVRSVAFSPNGKSLAIGDRSTLRIWDVRQSKMTRTIHAHDKIVADDGMVKALEFSPDGTRLATGGFDDTVRIWDTASWHQQRVFRIDDAVTSLAFGPKGKLLACGSLGREAVKIWNPASDDPPRKLARRSGFPQSVCFSRDGTRLAIGEGDQVYMSDVKSGMRLATFTGHRFGVTGVAFSRDGKQLISGSHDKTIRIWTVPE